MTLSKQHIAWVYILTNKRKTVLYTGYTTRIAIRMWEHRTQQNPGSFTAHYRVHELVYYKGYHSIETAKEVEKRIKGKSNRWKVALINSMNPTWKDLTEETGFL
jgi:putative endonuclease